MRFSRKRYKVGAVVGAAGLAAVLAAATAFADPAAMADQADADTIRDAAKSTGSVVVASDGETVEQFGSGTTTNGQDDRPNGDDQFRVASNTKMFVSTVLLQLAEEKKLDLDAPIGEYLPGLVKGEGIDENKITVRQLLQHTSGLADNLTVDVITDPRLQWDPPTPQEMIDKGLKHGSQSEPGEKYLYSNTGYMVLGVLVEELTGQKIGDAIDDRIVEPLGLEETSYAYAGMKEMKGPHFRGYLGVPPALFEVSGHEPGIWAGAGALVSSGTDLNLFTDALLNGKLLSEDMLEQMKTTFGDTGYGLGLASVDLSCGKMWGHTGHVLGYVSYAFTDGKGKSMFAGVNTSPVVANPGEQMLAMYEEAMCGNSDGATTKAPEGVTAEFEDLEDQAEAMKDQKEAEDQD